MRAAGDWAKAKVPLPNWKDTQDSNEIAARQRITSRLHKVNLAAAFLNARDAPNVERVRDISRFAAALVCMDNSHRETTQCEQPWTPNLLRKEIGK